MAMHVTTRHTPDMVDPLAQGAGAGAGIGIPDLETHVALVPLKGVARVFQRTNLAPGNNYSKELPLEEKGAKARIQQIFNRSRILIATQQAAHGLAPDQDIMHAQEGTTHIDLRSGFVRYKLQDGREMTHRINLDVNNELTEITREALDMVEKEHKHMKGARMDFSKGAPGNLNGPHADYSLFAGKATSYKKYLEGHLEAALKPRDGETPQELKARQKRVMKRMLLAQKIRTKMQSALKKQLQKLEKQIVDATKDPSKGNLETLRRQLSILKHMEAQLDHVNHFALNTAIAYSPKVWTESACAEEMQHLSHDMANQFNPSKGMFTKAATHQKNVVEMRKQLRPAVAELGAISVSALGPEAAMRYAATHFGDGATRRPSAEQMLMSFVRETENMPIGADDTAIASHLSQVGAYFTDMVPSSARDEFMKDMMITKADRESVDACMKKVEKSLANKTAMASGTFSNGVILQHLIEAGKEA